MRKFGGKGLYEIVWSSNEYLTVFPLILFPFMKTVFTEVLLMSPWIKFFVLTSCTYNPERWQRSWWLQQSLHLVGNDTTCISVLRLSDVRRQSDKSSWKKKYPSRDSKYSAVYIWFNTMAKYHFHFLNSIFTSQNALKCLHMEWIFTSHQNQNVTTWWIQSDVCNTLARARKTKEIFIWKNVTMSKRLQKIHIDKTKDFF